MNILRLKKAFAGVSAAAIMLTQVGTAFAAYSDVPAGAWFRDAVMKFVDAGYLDSAQTRFRPGDLATRAEFTKLVVELNGGVIGSAPATATFDDVAAGTWYYAYFENAAEEGWVRGDGACVGKHPCYARPNSNVNRAEAAALIVRAWGLEAMGSAPQFSDNPTGKWYTSDVQTAADHCVLQGDDSTGRVRTNDNMNRAEMVVMLSRADQALTYGKDCGAVTGVTTPKVKSAVATSATMIEVVYNVSVDQTVSGDKSRYTVSGSPMIPVSSVRVVSGDTVELTLASAMDAGHTYTLTVVDMETADGVKFSDSTSFSGYTSLVLGDGMLEVTLAAKNPVGDTIPKGAQGIVFTSIDLTATSDDVSIENLTILHEGFGQSSDFSGVYAVVDGARVTRKRTIDAQSYTSTLRFTSPLVVRAGKTVTLQIAGDLTTTATTSAEHILSVELPTDVISNAKSVTGNFPLKGKAFRVAAVSAGSVSVQYRSVTPATLKVGDKAATIGKWEVAIDSTEDQTIYSMTVENDGTASDGDFINIAIRRSDGTILTKTVASTVGDYATLVFDPPFTVLEGDRITMNVIADVKGGAAKNIKMHFDETGDIFAVGSLYGYGVNGQLYGSAIVLPTETTSLPSSVTIDAGQFTINVDGPVTQQFTRKDKNAVLANIYFETGGEDIDVEELYILIQGTTSSGAAFRVGRSAPTTGDDIAEALESVEIRNTTTGRTISGVAKDSTNATGNSTGASSKSTNGTGTGAYQVYRFDDFTIRGKEKYEFRVNFIDNSGTSSASAPANGDKFRIHICGEATHTLSSGNLIANTTGCTMGGFFASTVTSYQMKIKGVSTNDRVGDYRPGGTITGNFQEIKTSGLTITTKATIATDTAVSNAKNVNLLRFESRANEAADVLVTDFIFSSINSSVSLVNGSNYALWVDTNDDGIVDTILQKGVASQSGKVTFDKLTGGGYVVPKSKTVVFELHVDIQASLNGTTLAVKFDTGSTFVQAEQVTDGTSLSGIGVRRADGTYAPVAGTTGSASSEIQVTIVPSTIYTLRPAGDLYVTKSSVPVRTRQLLGSTLADEILRLQFRAEFEDIEVRDIVFTATGSNISNTTKNVQRLELYKVGATSSFATAEVTSCTNDTVPGVSYCAKFGTNQSFTVKKGENVNVLVRPRMNSDLQGSVSGNEVKFYISETNATQTTTSGSVRARGALSSQTLNGNDGDNVAEGEVFVGISAASNGASSKIISNVNNVVHSKVTSIIDDTGVSNGSAIVSGVAPRAAFKFSAAAADNSKSGPNNWTLSGVIFNVNATNVLLVNNSFKLYNKLGPSTKATCTTNVASASGSSIYVTCGSLVGQGLSTRIDPGASATFVLEAEVTKAKIDSGSTSTLQVSLQKLDDQTASTFTSSTSHISWLDREDDGSTTSFLWIELPETSVNGPSFNG